MPSPTATRTTDVPALARDYRLLLLKREAAARQTMAEQWRPVRKAIAADTQALLQTLSEKGVTSPNQLYRLERYAQFMAHTEASLAGYAADAHQQTVNLTQYAARLGVDSAAAMLGGEATVAGMLTLQNTAAVEAMVSRVVVGNAATLFQTLPAGAAQKVATALVTGIARGMHPYRIAAEIRRVCDTSVFNAQRIARTECMTAYRSSGLEGYRGSGVVQGWQWQAALDARTCSICWTMAGTVHHVSEEFDTHVLCRCVPVPMTMTEAEAAAQGWDMTTGADRFAALPREQQQAILGPGRLALYDEGTPLSAMVQRTFDPVWGGDRGVVPLSTLRAS